MPALSIGCEVRGCRFTTPQLDPSFYPSMVIQLQIHHSSIHTEAARGWYAQQIPPLITCESQTGSRVDHRRVVDELLAESDNSTSGNRRQEEEGISGLEVVSTKLKETIRGKTRSISAAASNRSLTKKSLPSASLLSSALLSKSPSVKRLGSTPKEIKKGRVGLKSPRLDLQFLCAKCNLVSFNTAKGLYQHQYRYCKNENSTKLIVKLGDGQNNNRPNKVLQKTPRRETSLQPDRSSLEKFLCPDCQERSYSTPLGLTMHRRKFCKNKRPGIFCFNCNKIFLRRNSLSNHVKKCGKTQEKGELEESFRAGVNQEKENEGMCKDHEHSITDAVEDKKSTEGKVMITVEFTSQEMVKSKLKWKVPVLAPMQRIMEKVCIKFSLKLNLLLFTMLGNKVNPGDLAGQYGGKMIQATLSGGEMTMDLDVEDEESMDN